MAKFIVEKTITRNVAAVGVVGAMTFCVMDPAGRILVVPSSFGSQEGNGWG